MTSQDPQCDYTADIEEARQLRVDELKAELYDDMWAGRAQDDMALMMSEEIGREEADLIRRLVLANRDTDSDARALYHLLETASTDYALRWADNEVERENKDEY